jgi:hypothetical protein
MGASPNYNQGPNFTTFLSEAYQGRYLANDGIPRRNRLDLCTPAELAIRQAMLAVEAAGAHPLLTDAVSLLEQAKGKVADFVDMAK